MIATTFCGDESYGSDSIMQTAQRAMRLPSSAIKLIRETANVQDPLTCLCSDRLNTVDAISVGELMLHVDYRP